MGRERRPARDGTRNVSPHYFTKIRVKESSQFHRIVSVGENCEFSLHFLQLLFNGNLYSPRMVDTIGLTGIGALKMFEVGR